METGGEVQSLETKKLNFLVLQLNRGIFFLLG